MRIKAAIKIATASFLEAAAYRAYFFFNYIGNFVYILMIYFLWNAIFKSAGTEVINGMTFMQTFIYLALARSMGGMLYTWTDWQMSNEMKSGNIAVKLIRPLDYQFGLLSAKFGDIATNFILSFIPTIVVISIITGNEIRFGLNLPFFLVSIIIAAIINMLFDFLIGTLSFYTESVWGISTMKDVVVQLLAGAAIPLAFFPDKIRTVIEYLPFQAVYSLPLSVLLNKNLNWIDYLPVLAKQMFWLVILLFLSRLFFNKARKVITVNGG